jgi:hypothetical protein
LERLAQGSLGSAPAASSRSATPSRTSARRRPTENQLIRARLANMIEGQTANQVARGSRLNINYRGKFKLTIGRQRIYADFVKGAISNYSATDRLYRHIQRKLGDRYNQKFIKFNRSTGQATFSFDRFLSKRVLVDEYQQPSQGLFMSYSRPSSPAPGFGVSTTGAGPLRKRKARKHK